ncbi:hypothetical protein HanRHA438_Chr08g0335291 [Helianthus annuus]|nr:hypothetical protein HanRHA438_Chr08g0335291 [Helianthus annuus]
MRPAVILGEYPFGLLWLTWRDAIHSTSAPVCTPGRFVTSYPLRIVWQGLRVNGWFHMSSFNGCLMYYSLSLSGIISVNY